MFQASQIISPVKEVEDSSSSRSNISNTILRKEVEDSSSIFQASQSSTPIGKQKILSQYQDSRALFPNSIIPMEEAEDSSPMDPNTLK